MKKNEATAADRYANPIPVYDADGKLKTGLTFLTASGGVFTYSISGGWVAAAANATENGTSGIYRYQYSQGETNFDSFIGVKLVKAGYDDHFFWTSIEPASISDVTATLAAIKTKTDGLPADPASQAVILADTAIIKALLHQHGLVDKQTWSGTDLLTARLRVFASAAAMLAATTGAADNANGEIMRFEIVSTFASAGKPSRFSLRQVL